MTGRVLLRNVGRDVAGYGYQPWICDAYRLVEVFILVLKRFSLGRLPAVKQLNVLSPEQCICSVCTKVYDSAFGVRKWRCWQLCRKVPVCHCILQMWRIVYAWACIGCSTMLEQVAVTHSCAVAGRSLSITLWNLMHHLNRFTALNHTLKHTILWCTACMKQTARLC